MMLTKAMFAYTIDVRFLIQKKKNHNITNKGPTVQHKNYTQHFVITYKGKEAEKE